MIEKLLENWLDSASERSYQAVFVQILAAEGYTVLHSTRHCTLEFGKDILAIAPDGVGCAFQLKGDPRGRMTVGAFRKDIQPQIVQLMSQSPSYPGFPAGAHRAYLVSNGQFDEEVQAAVREMNAGPYPSKLELWSRGQLFAFCKEHGSSLWPSELKDSRAMLELYLADPKDQLPIQVLSEILLSVLALEEKNALLGNAEFERAASSASLLTGIATARFAEADNHQAVVHAWTLLCVMLVAAAERHQRACMDVISPSLRLAEVALLDSLTALWEEVQQRTYLAEGNTLVDPEVYGWRIGVLFGLLSSLAIADKASTVLPQESRNGLHEWLRGNHRAEIWGEAAVANVLPWMVWLRSEDPTLRPDFQIESAARLVINSNQPKSCEALPAPYYGFEEVLRHRLQLHGLSKESQLEHETTAGSAFTAETLMHLLVRTNLKRHCKDLWPNFTKIGHRRMCFKDVWHYCLIQTEEGVEETRLYPLTYQWDTLKSEALSVAPSEIPGELERRPWLLALWWQVAPHRLNSAASRSFAEAVLPGWGT